MAKQRKLKKTERHEPAASAWPVGYRWLATGTLLVYTMTGISTIALAQSSPTAPIRESGAYQQVLPPRKFEIAPGNLGTVLETFSSATQLQIVIVTPGLRELSSPGVTGVFTPARALELLLSGTPASFRFTRPDTVAVELKGVATSIDVTAEGSVLQTSSVKYSEPLRNTPQTVNTISRAVIEQQATTTLRDALRNVAGISLAAGEGGAQGDNLTIRGFSARNDLLIDGMRDFGSYYRDPFNTEEVEVLQGPSSVMFGRGSTGGVINQSTKYPFAQKSIGADVEFGTDRTRRGTLDINRPVRALGSNTAFRLNLMGHEGGVAGRDVAENRRFGIAPSLAFGLGTPTRWTLSYLYQNADDTPDYGIPWLFNGPAPVNRRNYYGFSDGNFLRTEANIGTVRFEHDFGSNLSVRNQSRYANYDRDVRITEPRVAATVTPSTPLDLIQVSRNQIAAKSTEIYLDNQTDVTAHLRTGPIQHTVVTGVEAARETSDPRRFSWANVPGTSLLHPDTHQPFSGVATPSSIVNTSAVTVSAYALDTIKLGRKVELSGGARWDRFDAEYGQSIAPVSNFSRVDKMASWRAAAVYKPVAIGSVYVAASTSFNPSAESLALSSATANLPPEKNRNYEVGSKWDLNGGRLSLRTALFRAEKANAREPDPNNSLLNVLAGVQRVDGVQFEARGRVTSRWEVLSSYAYLDARVTKSNYYPAAVGARLANVPAHSFNIWNNVRLPYRWQAGLGSNYVSSRTASSTVPLDPTTRLVKQLPGYWVFNAMASHPITEHISFQANINNIANRYYYDQLHPGHIVLGPGRSAFAGIHFKF